MPVWVKAAVRVSGLLLRACLCAAIAACTQVRAATFDFLYIEANEGSASGGHAALRFGDRVYHFQHEDSGWLQLYRDSFSAFRFQYADRENRPIHGHSIQVDADFLGFLQDHFDRLLLSQRRQLAKLAITRDGLGLIAGLSKQDRHALIDLQGAGYFRQHYRPTETDSPPRTQSSALLSEVTLLAERSDGAGFIQRKRLNVLHELLTLTPESGASPGESEAEHSTNALLPFVQRYRYQLTKLAALDVLQAAVPPRPESMLSLAGQTPRLTDAQHRALGDFRERLIQDALRLLHSERPDWGYPLLVVLARLHAVDASLQTGYPVVLSRLIDNADAGPVPEYKFAALLQRGLQTVAHAAAGLAAARLPDERSYADWEMSVNALWQVLHAATGTLAVSALTHTPALAAESELLPSVHSADALREYGNRLQNQLDKQIADLDRRYRYRILTHNCVTEIFRQLNAAASDYHANRHAVSLSEAEAATDIFGGYIPPAGWDFIPNQAFSQVGSEYRIAGSYRISPYRERALAAMAANADFWRGLREANTLTSGVYRWNETDAVFLFFTQDSIWFRPLQGGLNLAAAAGESLFGLFSWPWDDGRHLQHSLKGAAVSLPELLFFNIRKGSFPDLLGDGPVNMAVNTP
ncbi:hypothetical protein [Methylomonas sp. HYX-M1]|uniref:hypothetical protein n=1 Tax=Methylomonas sp. HYX-M1 TaxID=3139307 RepID=UPI00345BF82C